MGELMNTREVAEYLRLKERKIYELVAERQIPCARVTGKWLFPKALIDLWIVQNTDCQTLINPLPAPPQVIAGSHDPLLEWAVRESQCELALLFDGSLDGLGRMAARQALACGLHVYDVDKGRYNVDLVEQTLHGLQVVALVWAWREQGLIVAPGNPLGLRDLRTISNTHARFIDRQRAAGSHLLLEQLLTRAGLSSADLHLPLPPARSETDLALAIRTDKADAGIGIGAVARQFQLDFVPLQRERYDLVISRRDYFTTPFQTLLAFTRSERFREKAAELGGYDISELGQVVYNAP